MVIKEFSDFLNEQVHLKLASMPKPLACKVCHIETIGIWVSGSPILQAVVQSGTGPAPMKTPMIFVPHHNIEWILADWK
jgi:hypothetical protein